MDSYIARLKDDVQCSLCNDTLTEPKILKCFHTFYKPCIKRHTEQIEEFNVFKCPQCKSETPLPDLNSVEDLRPSLLHSRMLQVLDFVESEKVCSVSETHSTAFWHCFDCNRSLCNECEKNHSLFTKDHNLASLAGTKEEDIKLMLSRETNCEHHVNKLVEWFCKDCEKAVCVECLRCGHEDHLTRTLSNYAETKRAILSEKLEQLRQSEKDMEMKFMAVEIMNGQFKESCEKAKLEVKEMLEKIFEILQKKALELTNQIDDEILKADKRKVKGRCLLDQQRGMISYLNKLLEKGIASEVIDEKGFEGKAVDIFQVQEKDYYGMIFVANEELLKQANLGLGILDNKLRDRRYTIGSAIACIAAHGDRASVPVERKFKKTIRTPCFGSRKEAPKASWCGLTTGTAPPPLFGSTPATASTAPLFGSPLATAVTAPSVRGSTRATTSTAPSLFSFGSTPATASMAPLFGSPLATAVTASSVRGSTRATTSTAPSLSLFGSTTATAPTTTTPPFGSTPATASTAPLFGTPLATAVTTPLFGSTPATATLPCLGSTITPPAAADRLNFGSAATLSASTASSGGFNFESPTAQTINPSQPSGSSGSAGKENVQTKQITKCGR